MNQLNPVKNDIPLAVELTFVTNSEKYIQLRQSHLSKRWTLSSVMGTASTNAVAA
jgi:hypothetical protein